VTVDRQAGLVWHERMMWHDTGSASAQRPARLLEGTNWICEGRLVASHEVVRSVGHVAFCGLAVIEALSGRSAGIEDPFA
jgi:hypothetical protein